MNFISIMLLRIEEALTWRAESQRPRWLPLFEKTCTTSKNM